MSGAYVKVFGSMLNSSIWCADVVTRIVWLTLLLLADADGYVWGAVPGIARQAGVEPEACRRALDYLSAPDPDSRTQDEEGRRIVAVPGGWRIVNALKYREMQTNGQRLASERSRRYREARAGVTQRDDRDASRASRSEGELESKVEERQRTTDSSAAAAGGGVALAIVPSTSTSTAARKATARAAEDVFDHWRKVMGKPLSKFTSGRLARVKARLQEGYTVQQLKLAVDGNRASPFHQGQNERGARYDDLELICRSGEKVEQFIALPSAGNGARGRLSVGEQALAETAKFLKGGCA